MGKMKELMTERRESIDEAIKRLEKTTEELECEDFSDDLDASKFKEVISGMIQLIRELKEAVLL